MNMFIKHGGTSMNMHVHWKRFINEHVHPNRFINEHVHWNRFINEHAKYNFSSPQFHRRPSGAEAFWRACCLLLALKGRYFVFMQFFICKYLHNAFSVGRGRAVGTDTDILYDIRSLFVPCTSFLFLTRLTSLRACPVNIFSMQESKFWSCRISRLVT